MSARWPSQAPKGRVCLPTAAAAFRRSSTSRPGTSVPAKPLADAATVGADVVRKTFRRGTNAVLLGERLLCLGMTCERVLCNTELHEKCAQAYVIANASGNRIRVIPGWVRL